MIQLRKWVGCIILHATVACFLTCGDLFVHWEKGCNVFERLLMDSDWAINNGNWLWLSCSSFFYLYHRIYSPISFRKKYDPTGNYNRHFIPALKATSATPFQHQEKLFNEFRANSHFCTIDMPKEYIYEPWIAPLSIQKKAKCIIGKDYPKPVVDHETASKECRTRMGEA